MLNRKWLSEGIMKLIAKAKEMRERNADLWVSRRLEECMKDDRAFNKALQGLTKAPGERSSYKKDKLAGKLYEILFNRAKENKLLRT